MGNLVVYMSMSLDGFIAAADDGPEHGLGVGGELLHGWLSDGGLSPGSYRPTSGVNAEVFDEMLATGAVVTGRRTFDHAGQWGGDHHDGVPIFVLTRRPHVDAPSPLVHYTSDLGSAVRQAKDAAGDRHVMAHGASSVQALLRAGLVDEVMVHLVPVLLGRGRRLFDESSRSLRLVQSREGIGALHLRYAVSAVRGSGTNLAGRRSFRETRSRTCPSSCQANGWLVSRLSFTHQPPSTWPPVGCCIAGSLAR